MKGGGGDATPRRGARRIWVFILARFHRLLTSSWGFSIFFNSACNMHGATTPSPPKLVPLKGRSSLPPKKTHGEKGTGRGRGAPACAARGGARDGCGGTPAGSAGVPHTLGTSRLALAPGRGRSELGRGTGLQLPARHRFGTAEK